MEVAEKAGVSPATVSRVLNKTARVSPQLTKRVLSAVEELRYAPDPFAYGMRTKKTRTIGLIISDITNPFFPEMTRAIEDYARSRGYSLILCNTGSNIEKGKSYVHLLLNRGVDGLIFTSLRIGKEEVLSILKENIPCILVGRRAEGIEGLSYIVTDNYKGGMIAADYLFELGHRRFVHVTGTLDNSTGKERLNGFINRLKGRGVKEEDIYIIKGNFKMESGYKAAKEVLKLKPLPTAIFFANDAMAIGALQRFWEERIIIPETFSIVGFDNIKVSSLVAPPLTTISQEIYKLGELAAQRLIGFIEGDKEKVKIVLEPTLVERKSCRRVLDET
ncbi:MAG: LacI family DNA-binding transcriptional regulator [bacterium]